MKPVKIEFILDGDAYSRLMQRIFMKKALIWAAVILVVVAVDALVNPGQGLVLLFAFLFFAIAWYFIFRLMLKRTFQAATNLHDPVQYAFDDAEVRVETAEHQTNYPWSAFQKAVEMPEWFLLYQNKSVFNPIPKSAFRSEPDIGKMRNLLITKGLLAS